MIPTVSWQEGVLFVLLSILLLVGIHLLIRARKFKPAGAYLRENVPQEEWGTHQTHITFAANTKDFNAAFKRMTKVVAEVTAKFQARELWCDWEWWEPGMPRVIEKSFRLRGFGGPS